MKTQGTVLLLVTTLSLLLSGCHTPSSTPPLPSWVLDPGSTYPASGYMTAVGEGASLRAAESQAFKRLAGRFKTHVQANEQLSDSVAESFGRDYAYEKTSEYLSDVKVTADETLLNVETLEQFHGSKGAVYVLAGFNRLETARLYEDKMAAISAQIGSLKKSDPYQLKEYAKARQALMLGLKNQQLLSQLAVIHRPSAELMNLPYNLDALRQRAAEASHAIRFKARLEGTPSESFERQISAVMTQRGFSENPAGDLLISGTVSIQDMSFLRDDICTVRYRLLLQVTDPSGKTLITLQKEGRESALSKEEAHRRAERTINALIARELNLRLDQLLDQLAGGES